MIKLNYPKFWQTRSLLSLLLLPLSAIYFLLVKLRHLTTTPHRLPAKVICVGNATVGGTGKTQVVIWLAKKLKARGMKPIILCKGYGGSFRSPMLVDSSTSADIAGDEALELCEYAATVIARKPADAIALLKDLAPDIIIVDDGMQNPGFIKDFIIMVVDGARGFGNRMLLPAGPMRQSVASSLGIVNAVVVTYLARSLDLFPNPFMAEDLKETRSAEPECTPVHEDSSNASTYKSSAEMGLERGLLQKGNKIIGPNKAYKATISAESLPNPDQKYYAFTGIGNPERFFELCKSLGKVVATKAFPDHHKYSEEEIAELQKEALGLGAKLITTRKDHVKLKSYQDIMPLNVTLEIDGGDSLLKLIFR